MTPDYSGGPSSTIYGLAVWPTKGVAVDTALVADPTQIVVAVRNDPTVAVSSDAIFTSDGSICRVIARLDCGVNDPNGLVSIAATTGCHCRAGEQEVSHSDDELPVDPDWDDVPEELALLAGLGNPVPVICDDGVSQDTLVVVPCAVRTRSALAGGRGLSTRGGRRSLSRLPPSTTRRTNHDAPGAGRARARCRNGLRLVRLLLAKIEELEARDRAA